MCVFISCVSEYTLESTTENIKDVYENRAPGYMGKTLNHQCRGWVSIGVCKLTKEDMTELYMQGRGQPVEDYRGSNCGDMGDSLWLLYTCVCVSYVAFGGAILKIT